MFYGPPGKIADSAHRFHQIPSMLKEYGRTVASRANDEWQSHEEAGISRLERLLAMISAAFHRWPESNL